MIVRCCLLITLLLAVVQSVSGQDWTVELDTEIYFLEVSTNGNYMFYGVEADDDDYDYKLVCRSIETGEQLWEHLLAEVEQSHIFRFTKKDLIFMGDGDEYKFINPSDGKVLKSIKIHGEDFDELLYTQKNPQLQSSEGIEPYYVDDIGIFYFDDGFQILDLEEQRIIYDTDDTPSLVEYSTWLDIVMIKPTSGADSVFFVDKKKKSLVYKAPTETVEPHSMVYQGFIAHEGEMLVYLEDEILLVDLEKGVSTASIKVDPDDPDVFLPVTSANAMFLITSQDDIQRFYEAKSGKLLWETEEEEIPGIVDDFRFVENSETGIMLVYDSDGFTTLYGIEANGGDVKWKQRLFEQDDTYVPGHKKEGTTLMAIGAVLGSIAANASGGGRYRYRPNWEAVRESAYQSKASGGYAKIIEFDEKQVTIVCAGQIYNELFKEEDPDDYNGEMIVTIDLKSGKVLKSEVGEIIHDRDVQGDYNAIKQLQSYKTKHGHVVVGVYDSYVVRENGDVEAFNYGNAEESRGILTGLGSDDSTNAVFVCDYDEEWYDYWLLDVQTTPARQLLIARSTSQSVVASDTVAVVHTLYITDESIALCPLISKRPEAGDFDNPIWELSEDDIDALDVGGWDDADKVNEIGVGITGTDQNDILILGGDTFAFVDRNGKCKWSAEWDIDRKYIRLRPTQVKYFWTYSLGDETGVVELSCDGGLKASYEISYDDSQVDVTENDDIVIADKSEGNIYCFRIR